MRSIKIFTTLALLAATTACVKETDVDNGSNNQDGYDVMTKNYTIGKSNTTGWWTWSCKDGSAGGSTNSRKSAKAAGKENCGSIANTDITPPYEALDFELSEFIQISIEDLDGDVNTFTNEDLTKDEVMYWMGDVYEEITDAQKVITYLKIFDVYKEGTTKEEVKQYHNLSESDFNHIVYREFTDNFHLYIDDETNEYEWSF